MQRFDIKQNQKLSEDLAYRSELRKSDSLKSMKPEIHLLKICIVLAAECCYVQAHPDGQYRNGRNRKQDWEKLLFLL